MVPTIVADAFAITVAAATFACTQATDRSESGTRWEGVVDTSAGGRRIVVNERGGAWVEDTIVAVVDWRIGLIDGEPDYLFGHINAIATDNSGWLYVADRIGSSVRVYDSTGVFLATVGKAGSGPGEFLEPMAVTTTEGGRVFVRDARRVTYFDIGGNGDPRFVLSGSWNGPVFPSGTRPSRMLEDGRYLYPYSRSLNRDGEPPVFFYLAYDQTGTVIDTLRVPAFSNIDATDPAWYRTGPGGGRVVPGLNVVPFSAVPAWDVTSRGTVVGGDGLAYELIETNASDDTLLVFSRVLDGPEPIPQRERADSLDMLQARIDSLPVPISRVNNVPDSVQRSLLPNKLPAFLDALVTLEGDYWIRRWRPPDAGQRTYFDVFNRGGIWLGTVVIPRRIAEDILPAISGNKIFVVVRDQETDVESVVRLRLAIPAIEDHVPST